MCGTLTFETTPHCESFSFHPPPRSTYAPPPPLQFSTGNPRGYRVDCWRVPSGTVFGFPSDEGGAHCGHVLAGAARISAQEELRRVREKSSLFLISGWCLVLPQAFFLFGCLCPLSEKGEERAMIDVSLVFVSFSAKKGVKKVQWLMFLK